MSTGARSQPPDLPNFEYRSWLGGGGFADVFLYDQLRPQRQVAVKVLRTASLDAADLRAFDAEANLMAKVSAHPYIVSIYGADVAADGRPFLVMEYYAKPNFGQRARGSGLAVQEVLRVGVRVASAVETAHRAGILHRDIKPANILVNDYDRPGLTDFGIAGASDGSGLADAQGMTVAYSPPEVLASDNVQGDEVGDVYSLAATLYALLAGRSPFEVPGGDNTAAALLHRTLNATVPAIGRSDVPRSLELLLAQAMAKETTHRPGSAAALARALQGIERELQLAPTEFELANIEGVSSAPANADDDVDSTRAGRIQVVRPTAAQQPDAPISEVPTGLTQVRGAVEPPVVLASALPTAPAASDTIDRGSAPSPLSDVGVALEPVPDRRGLMVAIGGAVVILAIVGGVVMSASGGDGGTATTTSSTFGVVVGEPPAAPSNVMAVRDGTTVTVTWSAGDGPPADGFTVRRTRVLDGMEKDVQSPKAVFDAVDPSEEACFSVTANATDEQSSPPVEACA